MKGVQDMGELRGWLQHGREGPGGGPEAVGSAGRGEQSRPGFGCWTKSISRGLVRVLARKVSRLTLLDSGKAVCLISVFYYNYIKNCKSIFCIYIF